MSFFKEKLVRKILITAFALVVILIGISVINSRVNFVSKVNQKVGEVAGVFLANKFLDNLIPDIVSAQMTSPYQDVQGDVAISGQLNVQNTTSVPLTTFTNTHTNGTWITLNANDASPKSFDLRVTGSGAGQGDNKFLILDGTNTRFSIDSEGRVGIGTANPLNKLHFINTLDGSTNNPDCGGGTCYWNKAARFENTLTGNNSSWAGASTVSIFGKNSMAYNSAWTDVEPLTVYGETTAANQETYNVKSDVKTVTGSYGYSFVAGDDNSSTGGTVYGLKIRLDNANLTRYGIYQETNNPNYFAGIVGIGINPNNWAPLTLRNTSTAAGKHWNVGPDSANNFIVYKQDGSGNWGVFLNDGSSSWSSNSDQRLKTNIQTLSHENGLEAITKLNPVSFNWLTDSASKSTQLGFIAQEVQKVFPNLISTGPDVTITHPDGTKETVSKPLGLSYESFVVPIIKAIQELAQNFAALTQRVQNQADQIQTLQQENTSLKSQIEALNSRLQIIEAKIK